MTETITHLSNRAVYSLTKQNQESQSIIVQVIDFQQKKDKYYIMLSDGFFMIKALPKDQAILDPNTDLNAIICIKRHMLGKSNVVGILQFEKLFNYKVRVGDPQQFTSNSINPELTETIKLQRALMELKDLKIEHLQNERTAIKQQSSIQNVTNIKKQNLQATKTIQMQKKPIPQSVSKPLNGNIKDYQTIKDLWIGMDRWTIICRIVKLQYSEFISKKTGKQTKVLSLQLMDRTGMKISGAFFGQAAKDFNTRLVKDRVYKISQGQIRQQSYNNSKNQKISPYKLVFTALSVFDQVSDTNSIAKNQDSAITLGDCVEKRILGQQFDVICILINIEQTVQVRKQDKLLKKTNLLVADPIKGLTLHAVVWSDNLIPDRSLVGKTIILSRFKLTQYKSSLGLSSVYKSSIIAAQSHHYQQYQRQAMNDYTSYEKLQEIKSSGNDVEYEVCQSIRQLEQKVERLGYDQWARSDLTVCINRFALKKWHYDGCPHCSKAAQSLSSCNHCNKYIQKTIGHFIMGVQICDSTGSMWTVAYDDWAKKIFNVTDQTQIIDYLLKLDANDLKEATQTYLYQQFRMRVSSKKDSQGRVKHNVSKIYERNLADQAMKNVELINKLVIS